MTTSADDAVVSGEGAREFLLRDVTIHLGFIRLSTSGVQPGFSEGGWPRSTSQA